MSTIQCFLVGESEEARGNIKLAPESMAKLKHSIQLGNYITGKSKDQYGAENQSKERSYLTFPNTNVTQCHIYS